MATPRAPMHVRLATATDAEALARLVRQYLAETFPGHPGTDADRLRHDVLENASGASVVVAEREEALIGFMSWDLVYDLHWGVSGALVGDLYVEPGSRGTGVALVLTTGLCAHSQRAGARFLRGTSYDRDSPTGRLYERFAIGSHSAECHCSGRAFRHLADLHGSPVRRILRSLPAKDWNYQP